eukprot:c6399_g1_i1.p1 GENE.c6399_g1_i1~~c6399_g1_i1.p1  ORF type:complete len:401 (-),score=125.68 c6399_g1_i1:154-1299(-)
MEGKQPLLTSTGEPSTWFEVATAEGQVYYFNQATNETCWEKPHLDGAPAATTEAQQADQTASDGVVEQLAVTTESTTIHDTPAAQVPAAHEALVEETPATQDAPVAQVAPAAQEIAAPQEVSAVQVTPAPAAHEAPVVQETPAAQPPVVQAAPASLPKLQATPAPTPSPQPKPVAPAEGKSFNLQDPAQALECVRSGNAAASWVALQYTPDNNLIVVAHGTALSEVAQEVKSNVVLYFFIRVFLDEEKGGLKTSGIGRQKFALAEWTGDSVDARTRAKGLERSIAIKNFVGNFHVQVQASDKDALEVDALMAKVKQASGAFYDSGIKQHIPTRNTPASTSATTESTGTASAVADIVKPKTAGARRLISGSNRSALPDDGDD